MNESRPAAENPLLSEDFRIPFQRIRAEHVEPGVRKVLALGQARIDALAEADGPLTFDNTLGALDDATRWVTERISPASHLLSVRETPELREAYNAALPEISAFWTRLPLHEALWARLKAYNQTEEARGLDGVRARHLDKTLRQFRRAGADLPAEKRQRLEAIKVQLAQLEQKFSENVLDATAEWERLVDDEDRLAGVPRAARARARAKAQEKGLEGWLLTLDYPSVEPMLKYAEDRAIRREVFTGYTTRCREGEFDNRPLVVEILSLRHELARLLGYEDFPDYRLEDHMARSGDRAMEFERDLVERTRPHWQRDADQLRRHAGELGLDRLRPWDVAFVSESLRKQEYDLDDEMLRPYFPMGQVMTGLFDVVERVFGFRAEEQQIDEVWHPDVRYYDLFAEDGTRVGAFYTDWFPRREKRQGAWMNDFLTGGPTPDGGFEPHLGVICGNFTPAEAGEPSLLTHREVQTIFHEFGHLLHHCTSRVPVRGRSGLNVPWDFVELPSQFMENWTWEREALDLFARHHETGEGLPDDLFRRMVEAKRFMGGWGQMRQLSLGSVDLDLHEELAPVAQYRDPEDIMRFARDRFEAFSPDPDFAEYHILTSFTHLFSGGYAAGYYSYLWSEVLDADAFTRFREAGIFDRETGRAFVDTILTRGDADDPEQLFRDFVGREPDPNALLQRNLGAAPEDGGAPDADDEAPGELSGWRRSALAAVLMAGTLVAGSACEGTGLAYGEANSIIVAAPPDLWAEVQDTVFEALEPAVTTTVEREEIFRVSYQDPSHEHWGNLRKFRQMLLIGSDEHPWIREALAKVRMEGQTLGPPQILHARDVWARNQIVTILLLTDEEAPEEVGSGMAQLQEMFLNRYREWATSRMFVSGRDSALADTLREQAGFTLLLPQVYRWTREDSVYLFRNDNPDPAELIRQILVTWRSPIPDGMDTEQLLEWRQELAGEYYEVPQLHDLSLMEAGPFQYRGKDAYQINASWQNPPSADWPAAGPFIQRAVACPEQDRLYFLDSWLYAPGKDKYEYLVQLLTILDSFRCGGEA